MKRSLPLSASRDPLQSADSGMRTIRVRGASTYYEQLLRRPRSAARSGSRPIVLYWMVGFRVVRAPKREAILPS